jgi:hypothetical protein
MYLLIVVINGTDHWFTGFLTEASCGAVALLLEADWWACVPVSG